jgi:tRNA(Ile2) C34 agmatinyltransferase TiaS
MSTSKATNLKGKAMKEIEKFNKACEAALKAAQSDERLFEKLMDQDPETWMRDWEIATNSVDQITDQLRKIGVFK